MPAVVHLPAECCFVVGLASICASFAPPIDCCAHMQLAVSFVIHLYSAVLHDMHEILRLPLPLIIALAITINSPAEVVYANLW